MVGKIRISAQWSLPMVVGVWLLALIAFAPAASAQLNPIPTPQPKPGSYGIEATKVQAPPTRGATITTPAGGSFSTSPIRVAGICPADLLVQVLNNGVMVGSVMCENGSFGLEVSLFAGTNEISAIVYDDLEQAGPASNTITVNYSDTNLTAFGELMTLTSSYGRRSAQVNTQLSWPLQLSGGTGPYAFSIDWGDGSSAELKSQSLAGVVTVDHTYKSAGIYRMNVRATDANGVTAFLQVVAVSSGRVDGTATTDDDGDEAGTKEKEVLWIPAAASVALLLPTFWLGRQSQAVSIRNKMLRERDKYMKEDV